MTKGMKTSEFWVTVFVTIVGLVNQSGALGSFTIPTESLTPIVAIIASYVVSRGLAK